MANIFTKEGEAIVSWGDITLTKDKKMLLPKIHRNGTGLGIEDFSEVFYDSPTDPVIELKHVGETYLDVLNKNGNGLSAEANKIKQRVEPETSNEESVFCQRTSEIEHLAHALHRNNLPWEVDSANVVIEKINGVESEVVELRWDYLEPEDVHAEDLKSNNDSCVIRVSSKGYGIPVWSRKENGQEVVSYKYYSSTQEAVEYLDKYKEGIKTRRIAGKVTELIGGHKEGANLKANFYKNGNIEVKMIIDTPNCEEKVKIVITLQGEEKLYIQKQIPVGPSMRLRRQYIPTTEKQIIKEKIERKTQEYKDRLKAYQNRELTHFDNVTSDIDAFLYEVGISREDLRLDTHFNPNGTISFVMAHIKYGNGKNFPYFFYGDGTCNVHEDTGIDKTNWEVGKKPLSIKQAAVYGRIDSVREGLCVYHDRASEALTRFFLDAGISGSENIDKRRKLAIRPDFDETGNV
ncbi:hypothetical protein KW795_02250, partial [Candidatus Microgenomates bacterium]|nr:hypothetical protein [Candidatus Microgenomates bacterium]